MADEQEQHQPDEAGVTDAAAAVVTPGAGELAEAPQDASVEPDAPDADGPVSDEDGGVRMQWVRWAYATDDDGNIDRAKIGTVEQMHYIKAKALRRGGRVVFVNGPEDARQREPLVAGRSQPGMPATPVVTELAEPAAAPAGFVRTRRNDPTAGRRMGGAWGVTPKAESAEPGDVPVPVKPGTAAPAEQPAADAAAGTSSSTSAEE